MHAMALQRSFTVPFVGMLGCFTFPPLSVGCASILQRECCCGVLAEASGRGVGRVGFSCGCILHRCAPDGFLGSTLNPLFDWGLVGVPPRLLSPELGLRLAGPMLAFRCRLLAHAAKVPRCSLQCRPGAWKRCHNASCFMLPCMGHERTPTGRPSIHVQAHAHTHTHACACSPAAMRLCVPMPPPKHPHPHACTHARVRVPLPVQSGPRDGGKG